MSDTELLVRLMLATLEVRLGHPEVELKRAGFRLSRIADALEAL